MKTIQLTRGFEAKVDDADYEVLSQYKWRIEKHANKDVYYARRSTSRKFGKKSVMMHRVIRGLQCVETGVNIGEQPLTKDGRSQIQVDHVNHDGLDNRRDNLVVKNNADNQLNARCGVNRPQKITSSKYRGVCKKGSRWEAAFHANKKKHYLGLWSTEEEAALAYNDGIIDFHGFEKAKPALNILPEGEFRLDFPQVSSWYDDYRI